MDRKKKLFPIGEVSKLFHISVSSLRRYETIGLLTRVYFPGFRLPLLRTGAI